MGREALGCGAAKFFGACRFSLWLGIRGGSGEWNCRDCGGETRRERNCGNLKGLRYPTLYGSDEWNQWVPASYHDLEVLKVDDLKFFVCPLSFITSRSWELLELVNETTRGENGEIIHMPLPGSYLEQPGWYREAVRIKRGERLSEWFAELHQKRMKEQANGK